MGASLLWTLWSILFCVAICKQTQVTGDSFTLDVPGQSVYLEDTVTVRCTAHGEKHLQFYKDGTLVQNDTQHVLFQLPDFTDLIFNSVSKSDEGLYLCRASEETRSHEKELKVTEKIRRVELTVSNTETPVGGSVTLSCDIEGWNEKHKWFRRNYDPGSKWENIGKVEQTISVSDGGVYSCRGNDHHVATKLSDEVTVEKTVPIVSLSQLEVFVGESLSLSCEVEGADTQWTYQWNRNTLNLRPTTREYRVSKVTESDRGTYSCRAQRDPHLITVWSTSTTVTVHSESDANLNLQTPVQSVYQGDSVTLVCSGPAQRQLLFFKDGKPVHHQPQHEPTTTVQLKISPVSKANQGQYSCGINEEVQSHKWTLTVKETKRSVRVTPLSSVIPVGGSVTLSCYTEGFTGRYIWVRGSYSQIETLSETSQRVSVSRGGEYSCRGQDQFILTPQSPAVTVKQTVSLIPNWSVLFVGESLSLSCEVKGADTQWTYQWNRNTLNLRPTTREYRVSSVTESDRGAYSCRAQRDPHLITVWSTSTTVTVHNKPQVTVSGLSEVQTGGSVVLLCSVSPLSSGWKYEWSRNEQLFKQSSSEAQVSVSEGGEYQCRASRGKPPYFTEQSHKFTLRTTDSSAPSLSVEPPWSQLFPGEQFSLTCSAHGAGAEWMFEWRRSGQSLEHKQREMTIRAAVTHRGSYRCRGVLPHTVTEWSRPLTLNVSDRAPHPVLSVSVSWLSPGASVSLSCAVTAPSAGWSFHWYRAVPHSQSYTYERLPGASAASKHDSFSLQGLNHSAAFVCQTERGSPSFYSEHSDPSFVWSGEAESPVSLSVSPDRAQHFTHDVITLSCGFNSTGADSTVWRRFSDNTLSSQQCHWSKDKSKCEFYLPEKTSAVFWCESGSGEMSNALNISVHRDIILMSPVRAVTEGQSVSLSCKLKKGTFTSVQFYKNGKMIQNGTEPELNITAVSRSDEGFYKCEGQWKPRPRSKPNTVISPESWMSIKTVPVSKNEASWFPVMWVVGPVCAVLLLILLLLLWLHTKTKDRSSSSETGETGAGQDNEQQLYSSLLHGDICLYETIRDPRNKNDEQLGDYSNLPQRSSSVSCLCPRRCYCVVWNVLTLNLSTLKTQIWRNNPPQDESCVYSNIRPHSSGENVTYAQVNHHKKKQNKGDRFTLDVPGQSVYLEDTVTVRCTAHGEKHLQFYKDGTLVQNDTQHVLFQQPDFTDLIINSVSKSDEGLYLCGASEETRSDEKELKVTEKTRRVELTVSNTETPVGGSVTLSFRVSLEVFVGESLTLSCEVEGADTQWTYEWSRSRLNPPPTTREYTVSRVTESDTGAYSCRAQRGPHLTTVWSTTSVSVLSESVFCLHFDFTKQQVNEDVAKGVFCSEQPEVHRICFCVLGRGGVRYFELRELVLEQSREDGVEHRAEVHKQDPGVGSQSPELAGVQEGEGMDLKCDTTKHSKVFMTTDVRTPVQSVYQGDSVTLVCSGPAQRQLFFFKDGKPVQHQPQHKSTTTVQLKISPVSKTDQGQYSCGINEEVQSHKRRLTVKESTRRVGLTVSNTETPVGGSVTLSCDVQGWTEKHEWFRRNYDSGSERGTIGKVEQKVSVSVGGVYSFPTVSPSQLEVFVGESLSLSCEVEGADTQWTYQWNRNRLNLHPTTREYRVSRVTESDTGAYSCRAQRDPHLITVWSTSTTVTVHKRQRTVTVETFVSQLYQ
ncbi:obscurin-like [Boleophthalmus pectinirostris]|uniref:obscurin-like n=1 Tax=Boleophthalmus pectinirostris TaxID=150288 RepID=UPI00243074BA|nr:obscurin-like [Boleophthalmus pectinirostris]